jgi:malate synthase
MKAYTELMVKTCHRRGAHAIGGMAAFIPDRRDPDVTETAIAAVKADKAREAGAGCDGTWVAHPDLVDVAREEFDRVLGDRPNQVDRQREDVSVDADDLLDLDFPGTVTFDGVRANVEVGILYIASWLSGTGAAAIHNLMEDVATAEISRSQIWQWVRHGVSTVDGKVLTEALVRNLVRDVVDGLEANDHPNIDQIHAARKIFEDVALSSEFVEFLTLPAYELINEWRRQCPASPKKQPVWNRTGPATRAGQASSGTTPPARWWNSVGASVRSTPWPVSCRRSCGS